MARRQEEVELCPICVEELPRGEAIHPHPFGGGRCRFHAHCLQEWRNRGRSDCPSCRRPCSASVYYPVYEWGRNFWALAGRQLMILALLLGIVLLASGATLGVLLVADRHLDSVAIASIIMWCVVVGGIAGSGRYLYSRSVGTVMDVNQSVTRDIVRERETVQRQAHSAGRDTTRQLRRQAVETAVADATVAHEAAMRALTERYEAAEAAGAAAFEAVREEANGLRSDAQAHEATTRRLTEAKHRAIYRAIRETEANATVKIQKLEVQLKNAKAHRRQERAAAEERVATEREAAAWAVATERAAAADQAAENERLRAEVEALRREQEMAPAARAEAADSRSVGDPGVEESKSETQASPDVVPQVSFDADERNSAAPLPPPSAPGGIEEVKSETRAPPYNVSRVSFDEAETGSTSVEGKTGSQASSPKPKKRSRFQKLRGWLSRRRRRTTVTPPPSSRSRVVSDDESDGGRRSRPRQVQYRRPHRAPSRSPPDPQGNIWHLSEWDDFIPI